MVEAADKKEGSHITSWNVETALVLLNVTQSGSQSCLKFGNPLFQLEVAAQHSCSAPETNVDSRENDWVQMVASEMSPKQHGNKKKRAQMDGMSSCYTRWIFFSLYN